MNGEWTRGFSQSFSQMAITMAGDQEKLITKEVAKMFLNAYLSFIHLMLSPRRQRFKEGFISSSQKMYLSYMNDLRNKK